MLIFFTTHHEKYVLVAILELSLSTANTMEDRFGNVKNVAANVVQRKAFDKRNCGIDTLMANKPTKKLAKHLVEVADGYSNN